MEVTETVERARCWQTVSFDWKIKDFSQIVARAYRQYYCSPFRLCGHTWILDLYTGNGSDSIALSLSCRDRLPDFETPYSLGIRSASGKTVMDVAGTRTICGYERNCMHFVARKDIKRSELFRQRHELLPLDVLTVTVTLKGNSVAEGATDLSVQGGLESSAAVAGKAEQGDKTGTRDVCVQTEVEGIAAKDGKDEQSEKTVPDTKDVSVQTTVEDRASEDVKEEQGEKTGTERVLQDIGKMWPSDEQSDVVFRVGDVEFNSHRAILSARTPALGAMFRHDTAEKASGVVTIEDCEPAVFEQLLHYVYKGAPREVTAENAYPLFTVADKYLVREVKTLCVRCMADTLSVDTFCNAVTLALTHREDELLETAVDFFSRNMLGILQTVQWQTFFLEHSTWANEIMIRAVKIREKARPDGDWSPA